MKTFSLALCSAILLTSGGNAAAAECGPQGCGPSSGSSCQACMPACQVCGGQSGMCCGSGEAIDIDSLTPKAQSKQLFDALQARLIFEVPEDADVYLSGQRMSTAGKERVFLVSVNNPNSVYRYEIKIDVVRGGKMYFKKHVIKTLRAGAILSVIVAAPPAADGETPEIAMEIAPIMPGGPAEDASATGAEAGEAVEALEAPKPPEDNVPADDAPE